MGSARGRGKRREHWSVEPSERRRISVIFRICIGMRRGGRIARRHTFILSSSAALCVASGLGAAAVALMALFFFFRSGLYSEENGSGFRNLNNVE